MKPIYIYKAQNKSYKLLYFSGFVFLVFVLLSLFFPILLKSHINKKGADEIGYAYRVTDVQVKVFETRLVLGEVLLFNFNTGEKFAEVSALEIDFGIQDIFRKSKKIQVKIDDLSLSLSKNLFEEVKRIKNQNKNAGSYIDELTARVKKFNLREMNGENSRIILSLTDSEVVLTDFKFGEVNDKTAFKFNSDIAEGGTIDLKGKTGALTQNAPWEISGKMTGINAKIIEKLAGDKLPLEIKEANINTSITAHSVDGEVLGIIEPEIKEFKLVEDKNQGVIKRNIAKVTNYLLKKSLKDEKELKLEIPFTLNQNFTLNVQETIDKIKQ